MLLVGFAGAVFAQEGRISYQAVVRNSQHQLLYDTNMTVVVGVYSPSETLVYSERHEVRSDANGLIALMIGEGTPLSGSWTAIDWSDCTVKTEMQIDGATVAENAMKVGSVPAALYADELDPEAEALRNLLTNSKLSDTLEAYYTREQMVAVIHDTADALRTGAAAAEAAFRALLQADSAELSQKITADSNDLANLWKSRMNGISGKVAADSVAIVGKIQADSAFIVGKLQSDSLAVRQKIDETMDGLIEKIRTDSIAIAEKMRSDSAMLAAKIKSDSTALREMMANVRGNSEEDLDEIKDNLTEAIHYASEQSVESIRSDSTDLKTKIDAFDAAVDNLADRVNTFNTHVCDSVADCVNTKLVAAQTAFRSDIHDSLEAFKGTLAPVAFSGSYNDLSDRPTKLSAFTNDLSYVSNAACPTVDFCGLMAQVNALVADVEKLDSTIAAQDAVIDSLDDVLAAVEAVKQPSLTLTSDVDASQTYCLLGGATMPVTFTATLGNVNPAGYTYAWTVGGVAQAETGSTFTLAYGSAQEVKCTAAKGNASVNAALTIPVNTTSSQTPSITCESLNNASTYNLDKSTITAVSNVSTASWYNAKGELVGNYKTANTDISFLKGTYTVEMTNSEGCVARQTVELSHTSCAITGSLYASESGTATAVDSVQDHEGNWYDVVQIGNQCWLKENMRCKSSPKGTQWTPITSTSSISVSSLNPKCYWYDLNNVPLRQRGYLYNWIAAIDTVWANQSAAQNAINNQMSIFENRRGICPEGWHVPTKTEWIQLAADVFDGITDVAAQASNTSDRWLQKTGTSTVAPGASRIAAGKWYSTSISGTPGYLSASDRNSSHFSVIPSAFVNASSSGSNTNGSYSYKDEKGASFYSATPSQNSSDKGYRAYRIWFECGTGDNHVGMYVGGYSSYYTGTARSVRCVRNS